MLTSIRTETGKKVVAKNVTRRSGPFHCQNCKAETIIKKGIIKIHHFAHVNNKRCHYGAGESELHMKCKQAIYDEIRGIELYRNVEMEKIIGGFIADVYAEFCGVKVAFEIQVSNVDLKKLIEKMRGYARKKIYTMWIIPNHEILELERHAPKTWERLLHIYYNKRIFYMLENNEIIIARFGLHELWKEETDWGGGYYYKSKRYVEINNIGTVNLSKMRPKNRDTFSFAFEDIYCRVFAPETEMAVVQ